MVFDDGEDRPPCLVDRIQLGVNRVVSIVDERDGVMRVWFAHGLWGENFWWGLAFPLMGFSSGRLAFFA